MPRSSSDRRAKERRKRSVKKSTAKKAQKRTPGWVLLLAGSCIGGVIVAAAMYALNLDQPDNTPATKENVTEKKAAPKPTPSTAKIEEEEEQRFDFYTLLPKFEVIIPESEIREEQERLKPKEDAVYMIQVGSFRSFVEAESMKAQLAFLGIEADVEAISSKGETWHRVRVGPFTEKRELNRIRNRLHANDYNTMLVKLRKEQ